MGLWHRFLCLIKNPEGKPYKDKSKFFRSSLEGIQVFVNKKNKFLYSGALVCIIKQNASDFHSESKSKQSSYFITLIKHLKKKLRKFLFKIWKTMLIQIVISLNK